MVARERLGLVLFSDDVFVFSDAYKDQNFLPLPPPPPLVPMSIIDGKLDLSYGYKNWVPFARKPPRRRRPAAYKTSSKTKIAKSFASSVVHNSRNLEFPSHALYGTIFDELLKPYDNLIPHIHYTMTLKKNPDGDFGMPGRGHDPSPDVDEEFLPEGYDGSDIEQEEADDDMLSDEGQELAADEEQAVQDARENASEVDRRSEAGSQSGVVDEDGSGEVGSDEDRGSEMGAQADEGFDGLPSDSSAFTEKGSILNRTPDITILHARVSIMDQPDPHPHARIRFSRRAGIQINHFCPALIGEFKRMPSRQLFPTEKKKWAKILGEQYMEAAYSGLFQYLAYAFVIHPYTARIMAFAASGIYWNYSLFTPKDVPKVNTETGLVVRDTAEYLDLFLVFTTRFSEYQEVGTKRSDEVLTKIRNKYFHLLGDDDSDAEIDRAHAEELERKAEEDRKIMEEASSDDLLIQKQQNFIRN